MRLDRAALLLGLSALPALAIAKGAAPAVAPAAVKPIAFTERTLANGLRVYAIRDTGTSNVSVQVWYDVGSKDDPKGRSGFAHMFEHLMFKATRNLVSEQMDRLTEDVGGYNNASTNDDYTNYYEVVPANHLERLLFAEADRMASLVVEPKSFASERDVVKEELRQNTLARPYGKLFSLYYPAVSYAKHPYARGTIGSIENLDSAGIDDVRAFHATYYRPDNAVLVVAGNFDPAQLDAWVDRYFAPIKRPAGIIPRVTVAEPPRTQPTHYVVHEPNTPLPAVLMSWHVPADNNADIAALSVLSGILSTGESSRLYESLVYRDQIAQSADTMLDTRQATGNFVAYAILASGKGADAGEAALRREIARVRTAPVTAAELAEAKNELVTAGIRQRETAEGKASLIAQSVIIDRDPRAADAQLAAIQRVTAADVQRVARKYLTDNGVAVIQYLPPADKADKFPQDDRIEVADTVAVRPLTPPAQIDIVTPANEAERIAPPAPGPAVVAATPRPIEQTLPNGMRLIVVEKHDQPIVTVSAIAEGGGALDPAGLAGTASLTADLMTKGTATRTATQIARAVEALGGSIDSNAGRDGASVGLTVKSDVLDRAMPILADVVRAPAFKADEIERARAQAIDAAQVQVKNPSQLAALVATRAALGSGPYATALDGTPESLKAIDRAAINRLYVDSWRPDRAALLMVGDVTPAKARALAQAAFGGWGPTSRTPVPAPQPAIPPAPRIIVVDLPDAAQSGVVVARPGIARDDARYYAAEVANTTLGGGFSSRLNQEIRIKRGLSYGAGSSLNARRLRGTISASTSTKNPSAPQVVSLILAEMRRLGQPPAPTAAELDAKKATLIGDFGREAETTEGVAGIVGGYLLEHVPLDALQHYVASVAAVAPDAVRQAAAELYDPQPASIVVVGDAKQFVDTLRKTYPQLEVIPADQLKLDSAALK